jgi:Phage-related minor tail protein
MPVTSYEVGAVFVVKDKASAVIAKIGRAVAALSDDIESVTLNLGKLGDMRFTGLNSRLAKLTDSFEKLNQSIDTSVLGMTSATDAAGISVRNLANQWRAVGTAASAARTSVGAISAASVAASRAPSVAGAVGGRGGRGFGITAPTPHAGGFGVHGGLAGQIGLGALAYGIDQQARLQDFAYRGVFTAGIPADRSVQQSRMRQIENVIKNVASKTGASIPDLGESTLTELRMMQGFSWKQKMAMLPAILQFGAAEGRLKGVSVNEGTQVAIGLAHMFGAYTPKAITNLGNKFGFLSTMTPSSPQSFERALGYSVPVLKSYGYNPFQVAMLTAMMQRAGILNTKSGTWIRNMAQLALPGTTAITRTAFAKHEAALAKLGLVGPNGKPTFLTNGAPDIVKMLQIAGAHINALPPMQRAGIEKQLFGQQGSGALAVLSNPKLLKMLAPTTAAMNRFKSGSDFFAQYAKNSPMQQSYQAWADLRNVLMDLSSVVLPPLTGALRGFDELLKDIQKVLPTGNGSFGKTVGAAYGKSLIQSGANPVMGLGAMGWAAIKYWWNGDGADKQKKATEKGAEQGARKGVADGLKHKTAYWGSGPGAALLIPASYNTGGGGLGDGMYYPGAGASPIRVPNYGGTSSSPSYGGAYGLPGGASAPFSGYHWSTGQIWKGLGGKASALAGPALGPVSVGPITSTALAANRARFAAELKNNPALMAKLLAISANEDSPYTDKGRANTSVIETMMNRAAVRGTSLAAQVRLISEGHGYYPGANWSALRDPKKRALLMSHLSAVLAGSNFSNYATDNSSSWLSLKNERLHRFQLRQNWGGSHITGEPGVESFEAPEWYGRGAYESWLDSVTSPALSATHAGHTHNTHITIKADGRTLSKLVHKHTARMGNMPQHSGRMPDPVASLWQGAV